MNRANIQMTHLSDLCLGQSIKISNDTIPAYMGTNAIINSIPSVKVCIPMVNPPEVSTIWYFTCLILNSLFYLRVLSVDAEVK